MPLVSGYAYKLLNAPESEWKSSPDEKWDTCIMNGAGGKFIGFRLIDGVRCTVWKKGGHVFAQTQASAQPPRGLR